MFYFPVTKNTGSNMQVNMYCHAMWAPLYLFYCLKCPCIMAIKGPKTDLSHWEEPAGFVKMWAFLQSGCLTDPLSTTWGDFKPYSWSSYPVWSLEMLKGHHAEECDTSERKGICLCVRAHMCVHLRSDVRAEKEHSLRLLAASPQRSMEAKEDTCNLSYL